MNYMLKMLKCGLCLSMVGIFLGYAAQERARADDPPLARDVGSFLGFSLSCGCIAEDNDYLSAFYYAVIAEDFGQSYAEAMSGEMRFNARKEWRNQASLCAQICPSEIMADMGYLVEHADVEMSSPVFRQYFEDAYASFTGREPGSDNTVQDDGNYKNWQSCYWRPNSPICADVDNPASPIIASQGNSDATIASQCRTQATRPECRTSDVRLTE